MTAPAFIYTSEPWAVLSFGRPIFAPAFKRKRMSAGHLPSPLPPPHDGSRPCLGSGRKRGIHQRALGRSRGGFTSKIHCLGDARGRPISFDLTPGEAADCKSYDTLIELPERAPGALVADKAYDSDAIRDDLKQCGIRAVIPPRSNRAKTICYNKRLYRQRNCIERPLGHLKINRAIATRYDQLADSFLGMLYLATARYWIKFVHAA